MKKNYIKYTLLIFLSLVFIELLFKLLFFSELFSFETIRIILFTLSISTILSFIFTLFKEKIAKVLTLISIFCLGLYTLLEMSFKNFMGNYMSISMIFGGGEADRINSEIPIFISNIKPIYYLCLLPFIVVFFIKIKYEKQNKKSIIYSLTSIIVLIIISHSTLFITPKNQLKSNKELYNNPNLIDVSLREFGSIRFLYRDIIYFLKGNTSTNIIDIVKHEDEITNYSRQIDDTKWNDIISKENDEIIKNLHQYYMNQSITNKNEYTGIFKDKNLIYIMVEALDMTAINKDVTPTLYKMSKQGWYFNNYYAPKFSCTTGESEFIALTSIIPSNTVCTPFTYVDNDYKTSIFNLFTNSNYTSTSYHSVSDKFYPRKQLHANMGSTYYNATDLNTTIETDPVINLSGTDWPSDLTLMQEAYPKFKDNKFFSFIITASMHFPYDSESTIANKNWNQVKDLNISTSMKRYLSKAIELDKSLEYLLKSLEEDKKLDDTVIVLYGDHHPFNLSFSEIQDLSPVSRTNLNEDLMPLIIYNNKLEPKTISKVASTFDLLPTIANLFDLDYDPRLYIGTDIFSDNEGLSIFPTGSWVTDSGYYYAAINKFEVKEDKTVDKDYIEKINKIVNDKFTASNNTLKLDYFKYLE